MNKNDEIEEKLLEVYNGEGMILWLYGKKKSLNNKSPQELIDEGNHDQVLDMVSAMISGNM